jgi:anti-sigma B factor antagonist
VTPLTIEQTQDGTDWVIRLRGELDMMTAPRLAEAIQEVPEGGRLIIDLGGLQFMDSVGLRALLVAHEASERDGGRLRLRRGPESVQRVFQVTGTESLLPFE